MTAFLRFARPVAASFALLLSVDVTVARGDDLTPIPIATIERGTPVDFGKEIQPILSKHCTACHNATVKEGGLILEDPKQMIKGGHTGPAVVPGRADDSLLLKTASHQVEPAMPPEGNDAKATNLSSDELGLIKLWIDQGATGEALKMKDVVQWQPLPAGVQPIYASAITSDGQYAACARANQIFVYHLPSGKLLTRLTDPNLLKSGVYKNPGVADLDIIQSLAFNNEGDLLASGGFRTLKLWRRPRNVRPFEFAVGQGPASAVAVSPNGKLAAFASSDSTIKLFDLANGLPVATFAGHSAPATVLLFSADGARLVSASTDQSLRVWSTTDGKQLARVDAPTAIHAASLVQEAQNQAATGEADGTIRIWDLADDRATPVKPAGAPIVAQAVSHDRKTLAVGLADGAIKTIDLSDPNAEWKSVGAHPAVKSLSFSQNGAKLASVATEDASVKIWDLAKNELIAALQTQPTTPVGAAALNPNGTHVVIGSADGKLALLKFEQTATRVLAADAGVVPNVFAVTDDGRRLATVAAIDGKPGVVIRDVGNGEIVKSLVGPNGAVTAIGFSKDGQRLAIGSADNSVRVYGLGDGNQLALIEGHGQPITAVALSADGQRVASAASDHSVRLWNVADGMELKSFAGHADKVVGLAFLANDQQLASASADRHVRVFNTSDGNQLRAIDCGAPIEALTASHNRETLAAALGDGSIKLLKSNDGSITHTLVGRQPAGGSVSFSPDDARLISSGGPNRALLWEAASGKLLEALPVPAGVAFVGWTNEPTQVLIGGNDKSIVAASIHFERAYEPLAQGVVGIVFHTTDPNRFFIASADGVLRGAQVDSDKPRWNAGHGSAITSVNVSPDGRFVATGGDNKQLRIWNSDNGGDAPKGTIQNLPDVVRGAAFSLDGKRVAAAAGKELLIYNLESGLLDERFTQHTAAVLGVTALPEPGQRFVSTSPDGAIVWGARHLRPMKQKHQGIVTTLVTVAQNKAQIVSGGVDGQIRGFDANNGEPFRNFTLGAPVAALDVRADAQRIAATGEGKITRLWNFQNSQQVAEFKGDARAIEKVNKFTRDVATAKGDVTAAQQQVAAAEKDVPVKGEAVTKAKDALAAADKALQEKTTVEAAKQAEKTAAEKLVAETSAALKTAEDAQKTAEEAFKKADAEAKAAKAAAEAAKKAADAKTDDAALAEAKTAAEKAAAEKNTALDAAKTVKEAADKTLAEAKPKAKEAADKLAALMKPLEEATKALATARTAKEQAEKTLRDAESDEQRAKAALETAKTNVAAAESRQKSSEESLATATAAATALEAPMRTVQFSPDGAQLIVGGDGKKLHTYDAETGKAQTVYEGHAAGVLGVRYTPDGEGFVSAASDGQAYLWDQNPDWILERQIGDVEDPSRLSHRVLAVAFSPDGKQVASGSGDPTRSGELRVWNVADGALVKDFVDAHSDTIFGVAFSPDGTKLASCGADKFLKVFNIADGALVRSFEGHTHHVLGVSWHWRGQLLATSGADAAVKVWSMETGEQTRTVQGFQKQVASIAFIGETDDFLTASGDGNVRINKATNGQNVRTFGGATDFENTASATPDGLIVIGGGQDGVLRVWNGQNGQSLKNLEAPKPNQDAVAEAGAK